MDNSTVTGIRNIQPPTVEALNDQGLMEAPASVSPSAVIAAAVANMDEQRRADRMATHALRRASHEATGRRVHQMRRAANHALVGAIASASATVAGSMVAMGQAAGSAQAALGTAIKETGSTVKGIAERASALDNASVEVARDQAQAASEQASDASSDADEAQRMADKALGHLSEIEQQINRAREAVIRG